MMDGGRMSSNPAGVSMMRGRAYGAMSVFAHNRELATTPVSHAIFGLRSGQFPLRVRGLRVSVTWNGFRGAQ